MILFEDGIITVKTVEQNLRDYFNDYVKEFGDISYTQWEGSQEYEVAYVDAQRDYQNAIIVANALNGVMNAIPELNKRIRRPAVLESRVPERFAEDGVKASIRQADETNEGIVAICVDYERSTELDQQIAALIVAEMLPAGQHMEGDISLPVVISNGQVLDPRWKLPKNNEVSWKLEITIDKSSPYPVDPVDVIQSKFLENVNSMSGLGRNLTPAAYFQISRDAPYAASIVVTYDMGATGTFTGDIFEAAYDDKFTHQLDAANVDIVG